jgi:Ca-activated chloride channel family protein
MQLKDAGVGGQQTRAKRASDVLLSVLERIALEQLRVSVVAFYTSAKPVIVDTFDFDVVRNVVDELPLEMAFDHGKTSLFSGINEAVELAKTWQPGSATLMIVSDGDTIPETGLPPLPRAINQTIILGVGDARAGKFIDGHQSRQDAFTLRQLAARLKGAYFDVNEKHLPSNYLSGLAKILPLRDETQKGWRELALAAVGLGALLLASLPVTVALAGSPWQAARRQAQVRQPRSSVRGPKMSGAAAPATAQARPDDARKQKAYA